MRPLIRLLWQKDSMTRIYTNMNKKNSNNKNNEAHILSNLYFILLLRQIFLCQSYVIDLDIDLAAPPPPQPPPFVNQVSMTMTMTFALTLQVLLH